MDKRIFSLILNSSIPASTVSDAAYAAITESFPYCNLLHATVAKSKVEKGLAGIDLQQAIAKASAYTANRALLKAYVMPDGIQLKTVIAGSGLENIGNETVNVNEVEEEIVFEEAKRRHDTELDNLLSEINGRIAEYHKVHGKFENWIEQPENRHYFEPSAVVTPVKKESIVPVDTPILDYFSGNRPTKETKKESKKTLPDQELDTQHQKLQPIVASTTVKVVIPAVAPILVAKPNVPMAKTETKDIEVNDAEDIIAQFLNSNPTITPQTEYVPSDQAIDYGPPSYAAMDDVITENMALIYIKQGKQLRAIEIYNKLSLKFPKKKAYFATQIDKLKK